jgi:hypothetical protein
LYPLNRAGRFNERDVTLHDTQACDAPRGG